jgi:GNAT superfamily N-acetyltransferase
LITDVAVARLDIDVVATGESFRRRGVARLLVRSLEEWAREQGAAVALATTYVASPISVPFWEQGVGYERRALRYIKRL